MSMIPGQLQKPYQLHKADSGAIRFEMVYNGTSGDMVHPYIYLISKMCPHETVCSIEFNYECRFIAIIYSSEEDTNIDMPDFMIPPMTQEFWLTWYNNKICMGSKNEQPFLIRPVNSEGNRIGFIKFDVSRSINWKIKSPPFPMPPLTYKPIEGGSLKWVKMLDNKLPPDAFIGGYENEPLYIARASHRRSLCPGKYVPSKQCAFIPWGFQEHRKDNFEILCGFNGIWIKCKENYVPENVFIAGKSEVKGENLYIGRAVIDTHIVVGKVHMLYKTCYLPYKDREVEVYKYEILVRGDVPNRGVTSKHNCYMNPMKAIQPCI